MKELLRIYDRVDGDVLSSVLEALGTCVVEIDAENGCLVIKKEDKR